MSGLDALRGFAAVAILFYHCHELLSLQVWPPWIGYLSMAVPLFFSLSAFSLCLRYYGRLGVTDTVVDFYLRRFLRIAPLFYFMLFVYMARRVYNGWALPELEDILLNLTFLFPFNPHKNESLVAAGWSLGLEMIFYSVFPILIALVTTMSRAVLLVAVSIIIQAASGYFFYQLMPESNFYWLCLLTQFAFFAAGMVAFHAFRKVWAYRFQTKVLMAFTLYALSVIALVYGTQHGLFEIRLYGWPVLRPLIGFLLTALVVSFALYPLPVLVNRATVFLGEISYGVYLIHPLVISVGGRPLWAALESAGVARADAAFIVMTSVFFVTCIFATASFYWLERPMMSLHKLYYRSRSKERVNV